MSDDARRELTSDDQVSFFSGFWQTPWSYLGVLVVCAFSITEAFRRQQPGSIWFLFLIVMYGLISVGSIAGLIRQLYLGRQARYWDGSTEKVSPFSKFVSTTAMATWFLVLVGVAYKAYVDSGDQFYRVLVGVVFVVGIIVPGFLRRTYQGLREQALKEVRTTEIAKLTETDFENLDEARRLREEKYQIEFQENRGRFFLIKSVELSNVPFFETCSWRLQPGVNILLGRNGYGKSLLLRSIAAILQRDENASQDLFVHAVQQAFIKVEVERDGQPKSVVRGKFRFTESIGKIPILAVPDSRFVNRLTTEIADESRAKDRKAPDMDLAADGARHFLGNLPYGEMFDVLFKELCYDYLERRSFDQPVFDLLQKTLETLTGDEFRFHEVKRIGRGKFTLMVKTEGNNEPLPIQYASQGTLSVLGVVGLIRSYLQSVFPGVSDDELLQQPAVVFVDELDAHLHPLWQQKLTAILRSSFPNTQFVLSAHSPLVVAGCWSNEVAVMRKGGKGFLIETIERDFIGTPLEEIYKTVFGVEDADPSFLLAATRAVSGYSNEPRISELEQIKEPSEFDRRELARLVREEGMIRRAAEVKDEVQASEDRIIELEERLEALGEPVRASGESSANA